MGRPALAAESKHSIFDAASPETKGRLPAHIPTPMITAIVLVKADPKSKKDLEQAWVIGLE